MPVTDKRTQLELLTPATRELLRVIELRARSVVSGLRSGLHRSKRKGVSNDFVHHRGYNPGDPLKHLDWKVYARTDRHYVKLFVEDSTLRLWSVVDYSGSMEAEPETRQGEDGRPVALPPKWELAASLSLALACLAINQQDQAGMLIAGATMRALPLSASGTQVSMLAHALATTPRGGAGDLVPALKTIEERAGKGAVIVIASDLSFDPGPMQQSIGNLRAAGHDVILFQIMSPLERELELNRWADFRCAEAPETRRRVDATLLKDIYRQEVEAFLDDWRQFCQQQRVDFVPVLTTADVTATLNAYLRQREMGG